jgi:hypothetical protein
MRYPTECGDRGLESGSKPLLTGLELCSLATTGTQEEGVGVVVTLNALGEPNAYTLASFYTKMPMFLKDFSQKLPMF